mmetsp:Transcript_79659/g.225267  ORF Transcript_79659/g.225267 Transcript_79659/m.225267 type:complete len:215 (-) Transcript_79659:684-1328(-)
MARQSRWLLSWRRRSREPAGDEGERRHVQAHRRHTADCRGVGAQCGDSVLAATALWRRQSAARGHPHARAEPDVCARLGRRRLLHAAACCRGARCFEADGRLQLCQHGAGWPGAGARRRRCELAFNTTEPEPEREPGGQTWARSRKARQGQPPRHDSRRSRCCCRWRRPSKRSPCHGRRCGQTGSHCGIGGRILRRRSRTWLLPARLGAAKVCA